MTYKASNPVDLDAAEAAQESAEQQARKLREHEIADFKWIMQDPRGRSFVWRLMRDGGVFRSSFGSDALATAFREGARSQALKLLNEIIELCPEHWLNMVKDQRKR